MIRLAINGALGRMGQRISALAAEDSRFQVVATIDPRGELRDGAAVPKGAINAVIDVSSDVGARSAIALARQHRAALVMATTALTDETNTLMHDAAREIAVMPVANLSPGVAVMKRLAATAATLLGEGYDLSISEHHHRAKVDAPSGTALAIAQALRAAGKEIPAQHIVSTRGGDVIGEHTVRLAGLGEYLEITHRATTRDLFARGALSACAWLITQKPGAYAMEDMLGMGPTI